MNRTTKLVKNTAILAIGTIFTKVISFIMAPLYSRWLTISEYGTFDLYLTYIVLMIPLCSLAIGEAIFRKLLTSDNNSRKKYISSGLIVYLIGQIIILIIMVAFFRNITSFIPFLFLFICQSMNDILMFILRGLKRIKEYTLYGILYAVIMTLSTTFMVYIKDMGLSGLIVGYGLAYFIISCIIIFREKILFDFKICLISYQTVRELLSYSMPLIPNSVSWWIVNVCDRSMISMILGTSFNGIYAVANKIPAICTSLFSVFHVSWQQSATEEVGSSDYVEYTNRVFNKIILVMTSVCICVLSTNFIFFHWIFDDRYFNAYYHAPILIVAILISFLTQFLGGIFISYENTKINGLTTFIGAFVDVGINLVFLPIIGLFAASLSTLISYAVIFAIRWSVLKRQMKLTIDKKNLIYLCLIGYFFIAQYFVCLPLDIINFFLACFIFIKINICNIIGILKR